MAGPTRSFAPRSWLRLPARTARLRLTLLYSGGFLLLGTAVITITFVLAAGGSPIQVSVGSAAPRATVHVQTSPSGAHGSSVTALPSAIRPPGDPLLGVRDVLRQQHSSDLSRLLAVSWLVFPLLPVVLEDRYYQTVNFSGADPHEWEWLMWVIMLGPLVGYGFLAGATLGTPDDGEQIGRAHV